MIDLHTLCVFSHFSQSYLTNDYKWLKFVLLSATDDTILTTKTFSSVYMYVYKFIYKGRRVSDVCVSVITIHCNITIVSVTANSNSIHI